MRIIPRRIEVEKVKKSMPWVMIYGRRRTGKTFLVENFIEHDRFFFVNRDATVLDKKNGEIHTYREFMKVFREIVGKEVIVVDEFHRLPESFLDFLRSTGIKGKLILITSTLWLAKSLLGKGQPLVGLVRPVRVDLVDEREIIAELSKTLKGKELIESSVYLREVMLIPSYRPPVREFISEFLFDGKIILKELIGEIFTEEERELTKIYEGVMKAVAEGKNISTEISTFLFSRDLISKDNPGMVQKYLNNLVEMGLLERMKVFNKKRYRYFHISPLIDLHYYLEGKYAYTEVETPSQFIKKVVDEKVPRHVEQFFRRLLAKLFGMQSCLIKEKSLEIDIVLAEFQRLRVVGEVKWKDKVTRREIKEIDEKLSRFRNCKKIVVVPSLNVLECEPKNAEVWDVDRVMECVRAEGYD